MGYNDHRGPLAAPWGHPTTIAARTHLVPRYGSPAEVAASLGVSTKTVRHAVESGDLPSYRVGRRVLVAFRDADQFVRRIPAMAIAPSPASPHRSVDARGRALPMTEEEIRRRAEEAIRALDEIAAIGDEEEQTATLDALLKALDEDPL
jgi:excisionase family DNA binding protein